MSNAKPSVITTELSLEAPLFQLNWKAEDLTLTERDRANSSLSDNTTSGTQGSAQLSTQLTIVISVVVPIVTLGCLIGLVVWIFHRRRVRMLRKLHGQQTAVPQEHPNQKCDWRKELPVAGSQITELPHPAQELAAEQADSTAELPHTAELRAELPGEAAERYGERHQ